MTYEFFYLETTLFIPWKGGSRKTTTLTVNKLTIISFFPSLDLSLSLSQDVSLFQSFMTPSNQGYNR